MRFHRKSAPNTYTTQLIYGAFDGVVTTFAVVAAGYGAKFAPIIVVVLGFANLFSDGFSIGSSAFLAQQSMSKKSDQRRAFPYALVTFLSFLVIGLVPLMPYFLEVLFRVDWNDFAVFCTSISLTMFAFIIVGIIKAYHHKRGLRTAVIESLFLGITAAGLAFGVGIVLRLLFGVE